MITLGGTRYVYFDVDNTLVFSKSEFPEVKGPEVLIGGRRWTIHDAHIEAMRDFKARGHTIVVWSAGGAEWAEKVIDNLHLEGVVDLCLGKPDWIWDDKEAAEFMPGRYYVAVEGFKPNGR